MPCFIVTTFLLTLKEETKLSQLSQIERFENFGGNWKISTGYSLSVTPCNIC